MGTSRPTNRHVYLRRLLVEQAAHPGVVDERLRRRLQLDVAVDAAPTVHGAEEPLARRANVVHLDDDRGLGSRGHEVGDFVLVRAAVVLVEGDLGFVDPEPAARLHAPDLEPYALPFPPGGNFHRLAVPAVPHVLVSDGFCVMVPDEIPALAHAGRAYALRLPAAGHAKRLRARPRLDAVEVPFPPHVVASAASHRKLPLPAQRQDAPRLVSQDGVHHGRMFLAPAPGEIALRLGQGGGKRAHGHERDRHYLSNHFCFPFFKFYRGSCKTTHNNLPHI